MEDSGEWHTVVNGKSMSPQEANSAPQKRSAAKPKSKTSTPRQEKQAVASTRRESNVRSTVGENPYHQDEHSGSSDEEEDDNSPDPIDQILPPYHSNIMTVCEFRDCPRVEPIMDTTALVQHLRQDHGLAFKNLHHMYMALDPYLQRWGKVLDSDDAKHKYGVADPAEPEGNTGKTVLYA